MDFVSLAIAFAWIFVQSVLCDEATCERPQCAFFEFQCDTGGCLNLRHFCDGRRDCPDGSDEILEPDGCSNPLNNATLTCRLPEQYKCDSVHHCEDKRDEELCNETYQMRCTIHGFCINKLFLNCSQRTDWTCSDKLLCHGPVCSKYKALKDHTDISSSECGSTPIFSCNSGECLKPEQFCDGVQDCLDGSDEIIANETNVGNGTACSNKWNNVKSKCVLPSRYTCDLIDHCDDRVDECQEGCQHSFFCKNGKCLTKSLTYEKCNGRDDCGDASDECPHCNNTFKCNDGTCIAMEQFCDGRIHCPDGSDEMPPAAANESEIICSSSFSSVQLKCVLPEHHKCDGVTHCRAKEDEVYCDEQTQYFKCDNGKAVDSMTQVCDFKDDCCDSSDECNAQCNNTFTCPNNGKCLAFARFCDGHDDCGDGSDEIVASTTDLGCVNKHNKANKTCVLPDAYVCDDVEHCENRVDECTPGCQHSFLCKNNECIRRSGFCDGKNDCADDSDEITSVPGFKCHVTSYLSDVSRVCVLPQKVLFDNVTDCRDQSDDCKQKGACFKCITGNFFISSRQVCDGVVDCPDLSDECSCTVKNKTMQKICDNYCLLNDAEECNTCGKDGIVCDEGETCISANNVCDGTKQCEDGMDEIACKTEEEKTWTKEVGDFNCSGDQGQHGILCDGIPQCDFADDECQVGPNKEFLCGNDTLEVCKTGLTVRLSVIPHCPGIPNKYLSKDICNGVEDCDIPTNGDLSADEKGCKDRWKCPDSRPKEIGKSTIHISRVCDGEIDCEGEEDEAEEFCHGRGQSRFYCENRSNENNQTRLGPLFVSTQQVLNGKKECWDNSDECPTKLFEDNKFSSRHRMIRNTLLSGMVWIMGILGTFGNLVVMWHSIRKLRSRSRSFSTMKSNYILVFNLATADLLMGVYLLALAIQNSITDGRYCKHDREWRSGAVCAALGSLAMVSLQASVCFLVLLTTYRMWVVLKPFKAEILKVRYTFGFVVIVWFISIVLAIAPRLDNFEEYFVSSALISPGVYFFDTSTPTKQDLGKFGKTLMSYANVTVPPRELNWIEIRQVVDNLYPKSWPEMKLLSEFGYYSAHSVCLPRLFVKVHDSAWAFSVAVMLFDFLSFLYVVAAYSIMYNDAAKKGASRQSKNAADENKTMQARITRLVLADFMCLVPVCITAFISVFGAEINPVAYAIAAIVLLPINSALNPILYSNVLGVIYSSCLSPAHACITKIATARRRTRLGENRARLGRRSSSYRRYKTSTTSDEAMHCDRMRLNSNGSTITSGRTLSVTTTSSRI